MSENVARFKIPDARGKLTGSTIAKVVSYESTVSKLDNAPQIQFDFKTRKGTVFSLWMGITNLKQVNTFLEAGILRRVGAEEVEVKPLSLQEELRVVLKEGKLQAFFPLDADMTD